MFDSKAVASPDKNPATYQYRKVLNRRNKYSVQVRMCSGSCNVKIQR